MTAMEWVKRNLHPAGGVRAWTGGPAYPEVSGYIIPTLLDYGERELAAKFADWLIGIQNNDGSFCDMEGQKRSFDTAAVMEGLERTGDYKPALKARKWLVGMVRKDGAVRTVPKSNDTHLYTMRVSGLLGNYKGASYWMSQEWEDTREHYVAYALEGLWKIGEEAFVVHKLQERDWSSNDLCANAQMAILHHQAGLDYARFVDLVNKNIDNILTSWAAKWILDMKKVVGD